MRKKRVIQQALIRHFEGRLVPVTRCAGRNGLARLFDDLWSETVTPGLSNFGNLDLYEDGGSIHVDVELPGCQRDDIELSLEDGAIHLQAQRKEERESKDANYYVRERVSGQWSRSVQLPEPVNEDNINATFKDGILRIVLEKQQKNEPHKIKIS